MGKAELKEKLINQGRSLGLSMIRIIPAEKDEFWNEVLKKRIKKDPKSEEYWEKRRITSDPFDIMPDAKSLVISVYPYKQSNKPFKQGYGEFSDHYYFYNKGHFAAKQLAEFLIASGYKAVTNPPLPFKFLANKSGIGYFGKNSLIHNKKYGSWFTIHIVLTDALLPYDNTISSADNISDCGACTKCMEACPTNAIEEGGAIVLRKCLRYHMLSSCIIPSDIREAMDKRILGCISCQACCPKNNDNFAGDRHVTNDLHELFNLAAILKDYKKGMKERMMSFGKFFGSNYKRAQRVLSMAVIAAGNTKDPSYIPLLKDTLYHTHVPIRVHSAWSLGKIGGIEAEKALKEALSREKDPIVISEINNALANNFT